MHNTDPVQSHTPGPSPEESGKEYLSLRKPAASGQVNTASARERTHKKYAVWYGGIPGDEGRGAPNNVEALIPLEEEIRASQESPVKEQYTGKHQCKGGSVSKVEMATPMALTCKGLFLSISTFETLPISSKKCMFARSIPTKTDEKY
jgi:hypothetical protein